MASIINSTTTAGVTVTGDNSGSLQLATNNGTTAVTVTTAQNVGIGTASPTGKLHVYGSGEVQTLQRSSVSANNYTLFKTELGSDQAYLGFSDGGVNDFAIYNVQNGYVRFGTNNAERMRITSGGAVLINSTSSTYAPLLQTTGDAGVNNLTVVKNTGTSYSTGVRLVTFVNSSDAIAGVISHSGVTSVTYGTSSDERLKENIVDAPNALDKVMDIKIRSYDWKEDSSHVEYGLVAQELHSIYGEPVGVGGDDLSQNAWSIEYGRLTPILLKAIQELNAKVEAQAVRIAELEGAK